MKDRQNHRKRKNVKVQFFQMRDIIFLLGLSCCLLQHLPYTNGFKGLMPFPEGEAPDGTRYKTAYRCEGETMSISCDSSETIQVIRANYGRFSIAICNKHGYTDWSVNCMSHTTTRILQRRCDSKRICDIEVNSGVFGDPCPNTYKYVEIHYACISIHSPNSGLSASTRRIPPWLLEGNAGDLWSSGGGSENSDSISLDGRKHSNHVVIKVPSNNDDNEHINHDPVLPPPRKPILVATDVIQHYDEIDNREKLRKDIPNERIPITTPKPTPSTTTVAVNTIDSDHQKTEEKPFGKGDESSVAKIASSEKENGKSNGDNGSASNNAHISTNNGETYDKNENIGNKQLSREENKEKNNARDSDSNTDELSHKKDIDKLYSSQENQKVIEELMKHHCAPITSRYLNWNWTEAGDKSIQPCPSGSTGLARWTCEEQSGKGNGNPDWHGRQPDMSDCKSALMTDLESRIRKQDPENVLASKLALLTEPVNRVDDYDEKAAEKRLYGGDLEAAVAVMKSIANRLQYLMQTEQFYNKESYLQEIFQNIFRSGSNLLSRQHRDAWNDLSRNQRIKMASSLMNILEEHAFLLADVVQQPESIIESTKLAAMTLSVIDTQSKSFLSKNSTIFPNLPQRRDGGGTVTRVGGNTETMSTSHFLKNPNNQNSEITQSRNRKARQKSGKTVNYKHNIFQRPQFKNKWLSNITDSIQLLNSLFDQQIFDSQYENGASASQFLQNSNKNDEFVGSVPAAKLINSQAEHDNNDDEVNAFIAQKQKLAKVIFFSFATLHEFLTDADQNLSQGSSTTLQNQREDTKYQTSQRKSKNLVLNSRIISASIDEKSLRRRTNQKYFYETGTNGNPSSSAHPPPFVRMQFKHIHEQMSDPICVYWNIDKESWSDSGCEVVSSNKRATTCQCNHLTHFALLMRFPDNMDIKSIGSGIIFDSGASDDVFAKRENSSTVITLEIAIYIISTVCLLILILLVIQFRNRIRRVFRKIPCCGSTCCCSDSTRSNKKPKSNVVGSDSVIDKTRHQLYASTANINGGVTQIHHQISTNQAVNNGSNLQTVIHHNNNPQHIQHVIQNQTVQLMEQSLAPHSHSSSSGGSSSTTSSTGTSSGGSTGLDNSQQQLSTPNKVINNNNDQQTLPISSDFSQIRNLNFVTQNQPLHRSSENILMTPQSLRNDVQSNNIAAYVNPIQTGIIAQPASLQNGYIINNYPMNQSNGSVSQPASIRATPINNQFELYPRSNQVTSPHPNRHSTTPTPLFTANGHIYTQSPPPYDDSHQQNTQSFSPLPQQQIVRTNSFTQATQNQPIQLNNISSGPVSLGPSIPVSLPLSSLPASPSAINATTVYYNPIHGNNQPNDASASIIFAAKNGLNRTRVFSSPNTQNKNHAIQKVTNSIYSQNHSNTHQRSGSCNSILSHPNNPITNVNVNGQLRNGQFTPSNDIILRNQVQNEVLYNHIHNQQHHQQSQFRRPKSHSPSTMKSIPTPTANNNPNPNPQTNGRPTTNGRVEHCYDKIHNRQLSSSSAAEDDVEYGYHSASSSSELERQQQRRVNQQRGAVNGECNGSAISPQANRNVHRPRSAGAVARQQEYIRKVASPTNQSILHLQKAKQEEQHQILEREEERPYNHVQLREFSPQSIRSPIHSSENHSLYQTSSPSPTKSSVSSTPIQDYYAAAGAPNVASYSASNLPNSFPNGGHPTHQYYSQPV